jgi:hypothetical protein
MVKGIIEMHPGPLAAVVMLEMITVRWTRLPGTSRCHDNDARRLSSANCS